VRVLKRQKISGAPQVLLLLLEETVALVVALSRELERGKRTTALVR
jgi:hypothetical protein